MWRTRIGVPTAGRYQYKLVINGVRWIEDPANLMKEPDGYGGRQFSASAQLKLCMSSPIFGLETDC